MQPRRRLFRCGRSRGSGIWSAGILYLFVFVFSSFLFSLTICSGETRIELRSLRDRKLLALAWPPISGSLARLQVLEARSAHFPT